MIRKHFVYLALALAAGLFAAICLIGGGQARQQLAYVACADKRVYVIDLARGEVVARSWPIEDMGTPTSVVFVAETSRLYISSQWDNVQGEDYYPLVAVEVGDGFEVVGRYTLDPERDVIDPLALRSSAVYGMVASETSDHLYLMYASSEYGGAAAIFDMAAERIVGRAGTVIFPGWVFSPDGSQIAAIWASSSRTIDGVTTESPGGVAVLDIMTGETLSRIELEDNRGLQPPWENLSSLHLDRVGRTGVFRLHDRDSGRVVSTLDLQEITGMRLGARDGQVGPALIEGSTRLVAPRGIVIPGEGPPRLWTARGFQVVIDYVSGEVVETIEVGPEPTTVAFHEPA